MNLKDRLLPLHIRCKEYTIASTFEALSIIGEIANIVSQKTTLTGSERRGLLLILMEYKRTCASVIFNLKGKDTLKYYNCIHHIMKHIISSVCLVEILELRELILLDLDIIMSNDGFKNLWAFYAIIYTTIFNQVMQASNLTHHQTVDLILLQLQMRLVSPKEFTKNISQVFIYFFRRNINSELQYDCLTKILSISFGSQNREEHVCYYSAIIDALHYVCLQAAKRENSKIDISLAILLLTKQKILARGQNSRLITNILTILNLDKESILPQLHKALKTDAFEKLRIEEANLIYVLHNFITTIMYSWLNSESILQRLPEDIVDFTATIKLMEDHFNTNKKFCQCCSGVDLNNIFQLYTVIVDLLKCCKSTSYLLLLFEPMSHVATELLPELSKKNCKDFDRQWSKCSSILNSIGMALIINKHNSGEKFLLLLLKQMGLFGFSSNFSKGTLYFIHKLISTYSDRQDYKSGVLFTAIAIYLDTTNFNDLYPIYYKLWYNSNLTISEDKRLYGIPQVLHTNIEASKEYIPGLTQSAINSRTEELLLLELNYYLNIRPSKTLVVNLIKQMAKCCAKETITSIIIEHYKFFVNLDCDMIVLLQNLLKSYKHSNLSSAVLKYLIANSISYALIQKNQIDMNNTIIPSKVSSSHFDPVPDPNDTCDIVSTYSSLSLKNHRNIFTYLECALEDVEQCYGKLEKVEDLETLFDLCSKLAHSFRLHCHFVYSELAWILAKEIATKLQDNKKILEVVGWILHNADLNTTTEQMLASGNNIAKAVDCVENNLLMCWYHLHISKFHLRNCRWTEAVLEFRTIEKIMKIRECKEEDKTGFDIHFAFLESAISRILCECTVAEDAHEPEFLPKKALKMAVSLFNKLGYTKVEAYHLTFYFEEIDDMLLRFSLMRFPREIRRYGKDVLTFSQKLVLSIRAARLLTYLAKADIISCKSNDCHVKLDGISDILNLPAIKPKDSKSITLECEGDKELITCKLADNFRGMQLHAPQASSFGGSPTFKKRLYSLPRFISHVINCTCFECTSPEYAISILGKLHIDFLLCQLEADSSISEMIEKMVLNVYNFLMARVGNFGKIISRDYKKIYNETYAYFLLDLVLKSKMIPYHLEDAMEFNQMVVDLLKDNCRYEAYLLLREVDEQRSLLSMHKKSMQSTESKDNSNDEAEILTVPSNERNVDKTPENTFLSSPFDKKLVPAEHNIERRRRNIPFNLSDDEDDDRIKLTKPVVKKTDNSKTPTQKFKIFDESTASRRSSRKKPVQDQLNTAFHYSTASSLASAVKARTARKTKHVTERLKQSAKIVQPSNDSELLNDRIPIGSELPDF